MQTRFISFSTYYLQVTYLFVHYLPQWPGSQGVIHLFFSFQSWGAETGKVNVITEHVSLDVFKLDHQVFLTENK